MLQACYCHAWASEPGCYPHTWNSWWLDTVLREKLYFTSLLFKISFLAGWNFKRHYRQLEIFTLQKNDSVVSFSAISLLYSRLSVFVMANGNLCYPWPLGRKSIHILKMHWDRSLLNRDMIVLEGRKSSSQGHGFSVFTRKSLFIYDLIIWVSKLGGILLESYKIENLEWWGQKKAAEDPLLFRKIGYFFRFAKQDDILTQRFRWGDMDGASRLEAFSGQM